MKEEKNTCPN